MQSEKRTTYIVLAVVAIAVLLGACVLAALVGGVTAWFVVRNEARSAVGRAVESLEGIQPPAEPVLPQEGLPVPVPTPFGGWPQAVAGALVMQVMPGTPAEEMGLQPGDIITGVDGTPIDRNHPLTEVLLQYEPGDRVTVHYWRNGEGEAGSATLAEHPNHPGRAYLGVRVTMIWRPEIELPGNSRD